MSGRQSEIRITKGAPLSRDLHADAERLRRLADDFTNGHMTSQQMAERVRWFAARLSARVSVAESLETIGEQQLESRRHVR